MEVKARELESLADKALTKDEALQSAISAAECYMSAISVATSDHERTRLRTSCKRLLSRAEAIKTSTRWTSQSSRATLVAPLSQRGISKREEVILLEGSRLNGSIFPRWTLDPDDSLFNKPPDGSYYIDTTDLKLSAAQRRTFGGWRRAIEATSAQYVNKDISGAPKQSIDLVQDITTDCSVVASLCAETARTARGHHELLDSIIYPYDSKLGHPKMSESGKYIFRLHFNGCFRKVVIDDRLPESKTQRSLHVIDRNNPGLIWPALLEKAYLKVRGGYDFPGSNSGTDLWVLTGWIPEQVILQSEEVRIDRLWKRINKAFDYGDVMITLGTGKLTNNEEEELGLAGEHDYAVLDMKEAGPRRMLLIKNPWCDGMTWKSSLTELESQACSRERYTELPDSMHELPGTFWMSFEDVAQHFEALYLNWNPGLFRQRQDHHFSWKFPHINSPGSFTHNPQFSLHSGSQETVWVLLSRHFTTEERDLIRDNSSTEVKPSSPLGYISLYAIESNGERTYLGDNAIHRGAYVDSPQTLARLEVIPSKRYTVVVAQHGLPLPNYSFTLSFFSQNVLAVEKALDCHPYSSINNGAWTRRSSGGNASSPAYPTNPQFSISFDSSTDLVLVLETDHEELAVHVEMVWAGGQRVTSVTAKDVLGSSGDYRRGCALASMSNVPGGKYTIVCSTFEAGQLGDFVLRVNSMVSCEVMPVPAETAGRLATRLPPLIFQAGTDTMLAPLSISRMTKLRILGKSANRACTPEQLRSRPWLKISVERGRGPSKTVLDVSGEEEFSDAPMGIRTRELNLSPTMNNQAGLWIVVERLGGRHEVDIVELEALSSEGTISIGDWVVSNE